MKRLKQIFTYIQGDKDSLILEHRIFNIASFLGGILLLFMAFSNAFVLSDTLAIIIPLIVAVGFLLLFYLSRFQQKFIVAALLCVPLTYCSSGFMWLINGGQSGSIIHGLQISFLFFFAILPKKLYLPFTLFHVICVATCYITEYYHPDWIVQYTSKEGQLIDQIITLTLSIACVHTIMMTIKRMYEEKTIEVEKQKDDLQELNGLKDKMLSIISHDVRGPLGQLKSVLSLVTDGHISKEKSDYLLKEIHKNVQETENLLDTLVTWASIQLQERDVPIKQDLIALKPIVEEESKLFSSQMQQKNLVFSCTIPPQLQVTSDANILALVIRNLLSNAIKFSRLEGLIEVSAIEQDQYIVLSVKDTGVGITPERLKEILELGKNSSTRGTNNEKGSGLGLRLCKEFIEKSGGKLHIESEVGKGSAFFVSIPIRS